MNPLTILLTACVNPGGMSYTVINDIAERQQQYEDALTFYLENTNVPIVVVENTGVDFSDKFSEYKNSGRLEYLTFQGNDFDKKRGKGYGEALILKYALEHSSFLKQTKYLCKITGRLIIRNIADIIASKALYLNHVLKSDYQRTDEMSTVSFIIQPDDLKLFLDRHLDEITESPRGFWLERVIYQSLMYDKEMYRIRLLPYSVTPRVEGRSGTFGWSYQDNYPGNAVWSLYRVVNIYKIRRNWISFAIAKFYFLILTKICRRPFVRQE